MTQFKGAKKKKKKENPLGQWWPMSISEGEKGIEGYRNNGIVRSLQGKNTSRKEEAEESEKTVERKPRVV